MKYIIPFFVLLAIGCAQDAEHNTPPPAGGGDQGKTEDPVDPGPSVPDGPLTEVPADELITYSLVAEKIFEAKCTACHSAEGGNRAGVNLESFDTVALNLRESLFQTSIGFMPPRGPSLTDVEQATLERWAELGAPN